MKTLFQFRTIFKDQLAHIYDVEEIKTLFQITIQEVLGNDRIKLNEKLQDELSENQVKALQFYLSELKSKKPIQYISESTHFYGEKFKVSPDTLIPRQETEELVNLILNDFKKHQNLSVIDIGTGSGCIAITLQKKLNNAKTIGIDISNKAIEVAKENAKTLETDIEFRILDILEWNLTFTNEKFDIIVSNPPYVTLNEKKSMHENVLLYEPHTALFVPEESPLLFYDYIADFAKIHLNNNGTLYFEINQYLAQETSDLLHKKGFQYVSIINDINNVPRMIKANKHENV